MSQTDREYFQKRAVAERSMATHAATTKAAEIHRELAKRYEALAKAERNTLRLF